MWFPAKAAISIAFYLYVLYTWVLTPTCSLPWVRNSEFCDTVKTRTDVQASPMSVFERMCHNSLLGTSPFCSQTPGIIQHSDVIDSDSDPASEQFHLPSSPPFTSDSNDAKALQNEAKDIISLLGEVYATLQGNSFCGKEEAMVNLRAISLIAKDSSFGLQKYRIRLLSSLNIILLSTRFTMTIARSSDAWHSLQTSVWRLWFNDLGSDTSPSESAVCHTLEAYLHFSEGLSSLYSDVHENLLALDGTLELLSDLIYSRSYIDAKENFAIISGRLGSHLGWNSMALLDARNRLNALMEAGSIIRKIRMHVFSLETQLEKIQASVGELESLASDSHLIKGPIPKVDVIRSLWSSALSLKGDIAI